MQQDDSSKTLSNLKRVAQPSLEHDQTLINQRVVTVGLNIFRTEDRRADFVSS
jgi:hypothetical protein